LGEEVEVRDGEARCPTIWRVDDARWAEVRPLLVIHPPRQRPGRPRPRWQRHAPMATGRKSGPGGATGYAQREVTVVS
jgi:hypothetical protein